MYIPFATLAEVDDHLFGNSFGDIDLSPETRDAHIGRIGGYGCSALTAQTDHR